MDFTGAKAFEISGEGRSFNCAQFGSRIRQPSDPNILSLLTLMVANLGTPVDCVSLALSGRLFPWSSPALVSCLFIISELDFQILLSWWSDLSFINNKTFIFVYTGDQRYQHRAKLWIWDVCPWFRNGPFIVCFIFFINSLQNSVGSTLLPLLLQGRP